MPVVTSAAAASSARRRVPVQKRSRERVERVLEAAGEVVAEVGVDAVTTRSIAERADIPVATLYQYFADKEAVLLALLERDMAEMDGQVAEDIAALGSPTLDAVVETAMRAFVKVYHRRPAFLEIWVRGRTNAVVADTCRAHNKQIAATIRAYLEAEGLVRADVPRAAGELAVELGDCAFRLAFADDVRGDDFLVEEAIAAVQAYLARFAA